MSTDSDAALAMTPTNMGPTSNPRSTFVRRLQIQLAAHGSPVRVLSAELGRDASKTIWVLAVQLQNGHVLTLHALVMPDADPTSDATCADIAVRLWNWIQSQPGLQSR